MNPNRCNNCAHFSSDYAKSEQGTCLHPWNLKRRVHRFSIPERVACVSFKDQPEPAPPPTPERKEETFSDYLHGA